MPICTFYL